MHPSLPFFAHWLYVAVCTWFVLGLLGTALSGFRGEWTRARSGLLTLSLGVAVYLGLLIAISSRQPTPVVPVGHSRCFDALCFQVLSAEEPTSFRPRAPNRENLPLPNALPLPPDRLLRVEILVTNQDPRDSRRELGLSAFLIDDQGHQYDQLPGLSGVPLTAPIQSRGSAVSSPVFRISPSSTGLRLLLRHAGWYNGRLTLADPESLLHRPQQFLLPALGSPSSNPTQD